MGLNKTHISFDIAQLFPFFCYLEYFFSMKSNIHFQIILMNTVEVVSGNFPHV